MLSAESSHILSEVYIPNASSPTTAAPDCNDHEGYIINAGGGRSEA